MGIENYDDEQLIEALANRGIKFKELKDYGTPELFKELMERDDIEEAQIMDLLMMKGDRLTCFNCGELLIEAEFSRDHLVAALYLDPGRSHYPTEPDEPSELYFECRKCHLEREQPVACTLNCPSNDACEHKGPHKKTARCTSDICKWRQFATGERTLTICQPFHEKKKVDLRRWIQPK